MLPLREALVTFEKEKSPDDLAAGHALMARALLGEGRNAEASRYGYLGLHLEARLVWGEVETAAGRIDAGRTRLQALEREAAAKGFGLIASRAGVTRVATMGR